MDECIVESSFPWLKDVTEENVIVTAEFRDVWIDLM